MSKHLLRDLDHLKQELLTMGALVEEAINKAIVGFIDRRVDLAQEVIAGDEEIDQKEVALEEDCLKTLALHQPVAADLRFIIAVMKVNNDLERMGDLAVNIAERTENISQIEAMAPPVDLSEMVRRVRHMVRESLDSLVKLDTNLARMVCRDDDQVDRLYSETFHRIQSLIQEKPESAPGALAFLSVSRHLERAADLATNIAEDVIFMAEGEVVRHRLKDE